MLKKNVLITAVILILVFGVIDMLPMTTGLKMLVMDEREK